MIPCLPRIIADSLSLDWHRRSPAVPSLGTEPACIPSFLYLFCVSRCSRVHEYRLMGYGNRASLLKGGWPFD